MTNDDRDRKRERREFAIGTALGRAFLGMGLGLLLWVGGCWAHYYMARNLARVGLISSDEKVNIRWPFNLLLFALFELACALLALVIGNRFFDRLAKPEE